MENDSIYGECGKHKGQNLANCSECAMERAMTNMGNNMKLKTSNMTIKELKEQIKDLPDEMEVILQKDSEGNGYSPLAGADSNAVYIPDSTWSGDVYTLSWTADQACMEDDEWEKIKAKPKALILYPTN
jgi:hypothetical protein